MMSIKLAGLGTAKHPARIHLQFFSLFRGLHAQSPGSGPAPARLTGYFSHETLLARIALGGVRQGGLCGRLT
jgi:hypothetical protein